jgi:hypothetical protein
MKIESISYFGTTYKVNESHITDIIELHEEIGSEQKHLAYNVFQRVDEDKIQLLCVIYAGQGVQVTYQNKSR